jgi:cytoskeletal protein RodZ
VGAFGEKLRKQRERRGLALDAISNTTKISTRMLRALEDEHFDQLPGGVFNKGFVRAYARQVGLDEEETVTDYLAALRESQVQSQQILPDFRAPGVKPSPVTAPDPRHHILPASQHPGGDGKDNGNHDLPASERRRNEERRNEVRRTQDRGQHDKNDSREADRLVQSPREQDRPQQDGQFENNRGDDRPHRGSSSLPGFITLAEESSTQSADAPSSRISKSMLSAAILLLLTLGVAIWNSQRHRDSAPEFAAKPAASANQSPSSLPTQSPAPTPKSAAAASPRIGSTSSSVKPSRANSSTATASTSTKPPSTSLPPKPAENSSAADSLVAKSTTHTLAARPLTTFTLMIRADQTTWISIVADGKPETHETLIAPAHTSVRASSDVVVKVGNAAGVSFQLNGKEFPPQGNVGEVRTYVFDGTGIRSAPQSSSPAPNL